MDSGKILIIDDAGFSRICSAILENEGFLATTVAPGLNQSLFQADMQNYSLVITSYPFGSSFLRRSREYALPVIVLTDHISADLIVLLEEFDKSYCMVKPLDYHKFKTLVKQVMAGEISCQGGYSIV